MLKFYEGTTYKRRFSITDDAGNVLDLTDHTALAVKYFLVGRDTATFTFTVAAGNLTIITEEEGLIEIEFTPSSSVNKVGLYRGWVSVTDAAGDEHEGSVPDIAIEPGDPTL